MKDFFLLKCLVFDPLLFDFDANNLPQIETALSEIETALLEIEIVSELFQIVLAGILRGVIEVLFSSKLHSFLSTVLF